MNRLSLLQLQFILLIICTSLLTLSSSTKHTFTTKNDPRNIIGPIGIPFGFLNGGVYNVTVFDFELTLGRKSKHSENQGQSTLKYVEAGFLLKRFDSESEFSKYHETIMEQPSICVFESHRSEDYVSVDASNIDDDMLEEDDKFEVVYDNHHDMNHHTSNVKTGGVYLSMNQPEKSWKPHKATVTYSFTNKEDEGLYFLIYQLCPRDNQQKMGSNYVHSSFELDLHFKNYDNYGNPSYLTAGEMKLPAMYLYFSISYALCFFLWAINIRNIRSGKEAIWAPKDGNSASSRPSVHAIHHLMTILLAMKAVTVFFESIRYHQIKIHGHAEFISAVYFGMSFIKGVFMFTIILLIGSGWSLVKTSLGDKEKKLIWIVLVLQVIDNIAVAVLSQETLGERTYEDWKGLLHFVDILCCCAILVPIVWQVNSLESIVESDTSNASGDEDGNKSSSVITNIESEAPPTAHAAHTLTKLKQFQRFYILVVAYIYFTRVVVYLFANFLGYKSTWLRYLATEMGTLVFYAIVGVLFRPQEDNPYLQVSETTKEAIETEIEFIST